MPPPFGGHDFRGFDDWVHVFTAGDQTDSTGQRISFTAADLDQVVANYNPKAPPPHVITHKELYSPFRFGDITALKRDGDHLYAKSDKVSPQLEQLVAGGYLPDRSIRLHKTPKGYELGHVAWLGAEPPAVADLAPVQFAAGDAPKHDFMLAAAPADTYMPNVLVRFYRRLREYVIGRDGQDAADRLMPDYEIELVADQIAQMERAQADASADGRTPADRSTQFSKHTPPPKTSPGQQTGEQSMSDITQADLDAAVAQAKKDATAAAQADYQKKADAAAAELASERRKNRIAEFSKEVDGLALRNGKVHMTPAQTAGLPELMASLADFQDAQPEAVLEFSRMPAGKTDKDAKPEAISAKPLDVLRDFMKALGPQLELGKDTREAPTTADRSDFQAPDGAVVDAAALALHDKALDYQAKHPDATYDHAIGVVSRPGYAA